MGEDSHRSQRSTLSSVSVGPTFFESAIALVLRSRVSVCSATCQLLQSFSFHRLPLIVCGDPIQPQREYPHLPLSALLICKAGKIGVQCRWGKIVLGREKICCVFQDFGRSTKLDRRKMTRETLNGVSTIVDIATERFHGTRA